LQEEKFFERSGGLVLGLEGGDEVEVLGAVFFRDHGFAGAEAVAEGIDGGAGLAFRGLGAGRAAGVLPVSLTGLSQAVARAWE
jgi:hypothetical protein